MKIFLSWSGAVSHDVAVLLRRWLPSIIQAVRPWTSDEIAPGKVWFGAISEEIKQSSIGIICLTPENRTAPWLLWEAGALYRGFENTQLVVPLLINLKKSEATPPLSSFQVVEADNRRDVTKLLESINKQLGAAAIPPSLLESQIEHYWPVLQEGINNAIRDHANIISSPRVASERTFRDAAEKFLEEQKRKPSYKRDKMALRHVASYIYDLPLREVGNDALAPFVRDRIAGTVPQLPETRAVRPAMVGTVNKELRTVANVLSRAAKYWQWIERAPTLRWVTGISKHHYLLTWEEQDRLIDACPNYLKGPALFILNTGLKRSEVRELRWSDERVYAEGDTTFFFLPIGRRQSKIVPLNSIAREVINSQRNRDKEFVFTGPSGGQYENFGDKMWIRAWERAGLPSDDLTMKGVENLRLTFGHRLRSAGALQEDIDALMGVAKQGALSRYSQPDVGRLIDCVERLTERKDVMILRPRQSEGENHGAHSIQSPSLFAG